MTRIRDGRACSSGSPRCAALDGVPGVAFPALVLLVSVAAGLMAYGYCASLPFRTVPPDDIGCIRVGFRYAAAPLELPLRYLGANWIRVPGHASYALDAAWYGLDPRAWHTTNLLVHLCNVMVFALAAWIITRNRIAVFAGTALFAIWPSGHVAVEWVAARHDLFVLTGFLAALVFYGRWRERGGRGLYAGALAALVAMLLSKETAITLAFSFILAEALVFRPPLRWRGIAPFALISLAYAVFAIVHFHLFSPDVPPYLQNMGARASALPRALAAIGQIWSPWFPPLFAALIIGATYADFRLGLWALLSTCAIVAPPAMLDRTDPIGSWYLYAPAGLVVLSISCAAASALKKYGRRDDDETARAIRVVLAGGAGAAGASSQAAPGGHQHQQPGGRFSHPSRHDGPGKQP